MFRVQRPPASAEFLSTSAVHLEGVRNAVSGRGFPIGADFKGKEIWSGSWRGHGRHKKLLANQRETAKCAYCEQRREVGHELDVEHFRPKAEVKEWRGAPLLTVNEPPEQHDVGPGYWWLAFEWSNYLLACRVCNEKWKRCLFPVVAPRGACASGVELTEKPLLLDPSQPGFQARDHFVWSATAEMDAVTDEGRATIITCGLNRKPLVAARLKAAQDVKKATIDFLRAMRARSLDRQWCGQRLKELGSEEAEFTGMVRWLAERRMEMRWEDVFDD